MIDESTAFGARAARHLREDPVVWFTSVSAGGSPVPTPVWFVWEEPDSLLMFSLPTAVRVRHVRANPRVSLNFAGDGRGGDIVVLQGTASIDDAAGPASAVPAYVHKYASNIERIGLTPDEFSARYSVPLRVALTRLRGH